MCHYYELKALYLLLMSQIRHAMLYIMKISIYVLQIFIRLEIQNPNQHLGPALNLQILQAH